ncbi:maleylacetate reductase [Leisingera daeponensis]|uniref:maleylacetate reductase n=1 Tax=Leisingera daeponensis TaxID=405746 RepID=UPI001C9500F0|nr:maleylacetate reductase [Leisingera daeponensis]MBY6058960.1 maleylacetate reductase [Leisingera daeponensis]
MFDTRKYGSDQAVVFEAGLHRNLMRNVADLGLTRILVLTTPQQSSLGLELAAQLGERTAGVFCRATMHTPVAVTEEAVAHLEEVGADAVLSAGGGSTIGLGKALALRTGVTQIALPTTYAGSECTPILGQTENSVKTTMRDENLRPAVVLYDPELVATLPVAMTVTSALNALAHAVEALYAQDRTPKATELALFGLRAFADSLPAVLANPTDLDARLVTQQGAWACGTVLGQVGMALHHKLCHTLGGSFDLPHAETHAIVLPHATAYNAAQVPDLLAPVAEIFGGSDPAQALWEFAKAQGAPLALRDLGIGSEDLDRAADLAVQNPYWNPREITRPGIRDLLQRAWEGHAPAA